MSVLKDSVKDTTTTGGTGTITVDDAPPPGFKAFSTFGNGTLIAYVIRGITGTADAGKFETGIGTVGVSASTTVARTTIKESSNADAAVDWTAGVSKDVWAAPIAALFNEMLETHQGAARPNYLPPKGLWLDTSATPWILKLWDGTDEILIGTFNATTNNFNPYRDGVLIEAALTAPTQAEAEAGTATDLRAWTAERVKQAIQALTPKPTESLVIAVSGELTVLAVGTGQVKFRMPYAFTLTDVRASLSTAQGSGTIFTVDINAAGVSILSTKLTIDNTEKTSTTAATPAVISDSALADDAEITIDVDQIGVGDAAGLKVTLIGKRT